LEAVKVKPTACTARQLAMLDRERIWKIRGLFEVEFDDGVKIVMGSRYIKLSWPYWGITRHYSQVKIPSTLTYLPNVIATDNKHKDMMSTAFKAAKSELDTISLNDVRHILYRDVYANAYNNTVRYLLSYMTTIDLDSWLELFDHPLVTKALALADEFPEGVSYDGDDMVEEAYQYIEEAFLDPALARNAVVLAVADKTIKMDQVLQAFIRGKTSEINSEVHSIPVWEGFFNGISTAAGAAKESRAAARSHVFNTDNIADAEYGSRKFQLVCNVIHNHSDGDCGTKHYHVQTFEDTRESKDQLRNMIGINFRVEGSPMGWTPMEEHHIEQILGKTIHYRTAMCCSKMSEQGVCKTCYGDLYYSLSDQAAPGHLSTTSISERGTQGILSTKHLDFLRRIVSIIMRSQVIRYFERYENKQIKGLRLRDKTPRGTWANYRIMVDQETYNSLEIVRFESNLKDLDIHAVADLENMTFVEIGKDGTIIEEDTINVQMGINGYLSYEFLKYYQTVVDDVEKHGKFYLIPVEKWDTSKHILQYHNRSESLAEFVDGYEAKVRSNSSYEGEERLTKTSRRKAIRNLVSMGGATEEECTFALIDTHRYLERKLKGINLAHIAMVLACSRVEGWDNPFPAAGFDSQPADHVNGKRFVDHDTLIGMRSISTALIFERQQDYVDNIRPYVQRKVPSGLYDGAFVPIHG
tara:strand:- start:2643 stop:4730 length:2088 start_codon:yes stop_codon:yes gene_type:complete